ncbi:hypothetical protein [Streptomyces sp. NPDC051636]|uniref:hypothetical protein n=1 Tax=Streptomyces sp. NPDC051636 TaxID=3365663 RepID=UPI0037A952F9
MDDTQGGGATRGGVEGERHNRVVGPVEVHPDHHVIAGHHRGENAGLLVPGGAGADQHHRSRRPGHGRPAHGSEEESGGPAQSP